MGKIPIDTIIQKYGSEEAYKKYLTEKLSGKHFWTNGIEDRKFSDNDTPPQGWWRGRTHSGKGTKGYIFINNGIIQTQIPSTETIPEGYTKGALPFTESHKKKISESLQAYERTEEHNKKLLEAHQSDLCKNKIKNTNLERYGVECVLSCEEVKSKIKETNKQRYGFEYASSSPEIRSKVNETCLERYGVDYACQTSQCRLSYSKNNSTPNKEFEEYLKMLNVHYEREFSLNKYSYDFKVNNTLIEIDPFSTHNSTWGIFNTPGIDANYHINKSKCAEENNYRCIHIFDWDDKNKILQLITSRETIYARNCIIKEVPIKDTNNYLNHYHLQGTCRYQTIRLGLYYNDNLVSLMTFGKSRYNTNYEWELLRYCSSYNIIGGVEKLFKYFINKYTPKSIISYCDRSKFKGNIYYKLGFISNNKYSPSKHWYNPKTHQHITDNLLRQRGYDQLFNANYGKNTSNEELMKENGFVEIYDCGQQTFTYNNKN